MTEATEATEATEDRKEEAAAADQMAAAEPGLTSMLLRDIAVAFAALSLWAAADTWHQVTGLWFAQVLAIGDALLVGLLLAALFHEWGHYFGARAAGATVCRKAPEGLSLLRFDFDYASNDHRQFHWMTYGGHVLHWSILLLLLIALPLDSLSRIALAGSVFGFIVFATVIEYNIVKDTWTGTDPGERLSQITSQDFEQATLIGGVGGLFAIAALA
ncbi:MAG: hypothetical protein P8L31_02905 [Pseudomonadales bacterium]|nr:hypothetical protein [Pseudomonadales bacterium]